MTALRLTVQPSVKAQGWQTEQEFSLSGNGSKEMGVSTPAQQNQKLCGSAAQAPENARSEDRAKMEERKWQQFFHDRNNRRNERYLDFVLAITGESLWVQSYICPEWVPPKLKCLENSSPVVGQSLRAHYSKGEVQSGRLSYVGDKEHSIRKCGQGREAIRLYDKMLQDGLGPSISMVVAAFKACTSLRDLKTGRKIHADVIESRDDSNIFVANTLVDMYAKCGSLVDARRVFDKMTRRTVVSWNAIILGYAQSGEGELALQLFAQMQDKGFTPNARTFVAALKSCTSLAAKEEGKQVDGKLLKTMCLEKGIAIHSEAASSGHELDIFVASTLMDMYAKCGSLVDARLVFDRMPHHDVVSWNAIILAHAQSGEGELALQLFAQMQDEGFRPDARTFVGALNACTTLAVKEEGKQVLGGLVRKVWLEKGIAIHSQVTKSRHDSDIFVSNTLVDMYSKCGSMVDARRVFDRMLHRTVVSWNAIILGYAQSGEGELALQLFAQMQDKGFTPDARTFVAALQACASLAAKEVGKQVGEKLLKLVCLKKGKAIHSQVVKSVHELDIFVASTLVDMYSKCGSMVDAHRVFDRMPRHGVVSWNAIILGYAQNGEGEFALQLFAQMQDEGFRPDARTFIAALTACTSLAAKEQGKQVEEGLVKPVCLEKGIAIHCQVAKSGHDSDMFVASSLVDMYIICGSMVDARRVFDRMPHHSLVSSQSEKKLPLWTDPLNTKCSQGRDAIRIYDSMQEHGVAPSISIVLAALKACTSSRDIQTGTRIYDAVLESRDDSNIFVANTLVDMFAKCGSMVDARRVFDRMSHHTVVSWNAIILGYAQSGEGEVALQLFAQMQDKGFTPDARTFVAALNACTSLAVKEEGKLVDGRLVKLMCLEKGIAIHSEVTKSGHDSDIFLANTLVDMYAKCGSMVDARRVFDMMLHRDVVSWNAIILGYAQSGEGELALQLFAQMQDEGFTPTARTFVAALKSCTSLAAKVGLEKGRAIHSQVAKSGHGSDIFVASSLADMYVKFGSMVDARQVFDRMPHPDVVSWTGIILGYAQSGDGEMALQLFAQMHVKGCAPNARTYVAALNACSSLAEKEEGKEVEGGLVKLVCLEKGISIHSEAARSGLDSDIFVANTLVDMYAKCGSMVDARSVFDRMPHHGVVSWTAIILGYIQSGEADLSLQLYAHMRDEGFKPDALTFVAALKACGSLAALDTGKGIHAEICIGGLQNDAVVANCLVDFYGKCGSMVDAQQVFDSTATRNLVTWSALIAGYSRQGDTKRVFNLFERMQKERLQADGVTFLSILTACSHAGLVEKGKEYFQAMRSDSLITPGIEHYTCMVDLLGRANHLDDAVEMVKNIPFEANLRIWTTILGACRKWRNVDVGRLAFESILRLDDRNAGAYVLMANIYAGAGMWEESAKMHAMRRNARAWKKPGQSWWTDNAGGVHTFVVGDTSHPQSEDIQAKLKDVLVKMKDEGYVPDLDSVLHNISDDEKESALCGHSEKLAIGCALINTAPGTAIRIVKNLRVCDDCHKAIAIISKIEQRGIICRDANRFHVFKDGKCSCGDFW